MTATTTCPDVKDVLIIGGGPAGLSAAINLARSLHTVVVFDSGKYRNALLPHLHGAPGWDHKDPASIRSQMQKDLLTRYDTASIAHVEVLHVARLQEPRTVFIVTNSSGEKWQGRKLVLATGVSDILPEMPGYENCWVKGIYHCLTSQGFEERGCKTAGVLGIGDCATLFACLRLAMQAKQLSDQVRVYTDGDQELAAQLRQEISSRPGIILEDRKILKVAKMPEGAAIIVSLEDGTRFTEGFLVHKPKMRMNGPFVGQLGLETFTFGHEIIKVNPPFHETSMKGVFAIGDCASAQKVFVHAVSMGSFACAGLAAQLQMEASEGYDP